MIGIIDVNACTYYEISREAANELPEVIALEVSTIGGSRQLVVCANCEGRDSAYRVMQGRVGKVLPMNVNESSATLGAVVRTRGSTYCLASQCKAELE